MPIDKFPIEFPEDIGQITNPVGGSYQKNKDLKSYYTSQSQGYARDIEFLNEKIEEIESIQQPLKSAAAVPDKALAESVVRYNEQVNIISQTSQDAISCGCTFTYDASAGTAKTFTVLYENLIADKKRLNRLGYGGDEPLEDNGDISLVDSSSNPVSIKESNLGDGQDTTISDGDPVNYFEILNFEPFLSCGNCVSLYNQQQAAIAAADAAQNESIRTSGITQADSIKTEREELLKERWTLVFAKEKTEARKANADAFLASGNYKGAP